MLPNYAFFFNRGGKIMNVMFSRRDLTQKLYKMEVFASRNYTKDALIHVLYIVTKRFHCYAYCTHKSVLGSPGPN